MLPACENPSVSKTAAPRMQLGSDSWVLQPTSHKSIPFSNAPQHPKWQAPQSHHPTLPWQEREAFFAEMATERRRLSDATADSNRQVEEARSTLSCLRSDLASYEAAAAAAMRQVKEDETHAASIRKAIEQDQAELSLGKKELKVRGVERQGTLNTGRSVTHIQVRARSFEESKKLEVLRAVPHSRVGCRQARPHKARARHGGVCSRTPAAGAPTGFQCDATL